MSLYVTVFIIKKTRSWNKNEVARTVSDDGGDESGRVLERF